jgi:hypothetical protein
MTWEVMDCICLVLHTARGGMADALALFQEELGLRAAGGGERQLEML